MSLCLVELRPPDSTSPFLEFWARGPQYPPELTPRLPAGLHPLRSGHSTLHTQGCKSARACAQVDFVESKPPNQTLPGEGFGGAGDTGDAGDAGDAGEPGDTRDAGDAGNTRDADDKHDVGDPARQAQLPLKPQKSPDPPNP